MLNCLGCLIIILETQVYFSALYTQYEDTLLSHCTINEVSTVFLEVLGKTCACDAQYSCSKKSSGRKSS